MIQIDGLKLTLRPRTFDLYIVAEIFLENSYLIPNLKAKSLETVIDLGANIGIFSLWIAQKYSPKKIISVEMDKDNFNQLLLNTKTNSDILSSGFVAINKAIYSSKTNLHYEKVLINKGMHNLTEKNFGKNTVQTTTLSEIIEDNNLKIIDLIKIDIEGSEKHLLNLENKEIFSEKVKYIAMEVHVNENFKINNVEEYFSGLGFKCSIYKHWSCVNYLFYAENLKLI